MSRSARTSKHWPRRPGAIALIGSAPFIAAKAFVFVSAVFEFNEPMYASYLVHTQALVNGDYATPSAITYAYAIALPLHALWVFSLIRSRIEPRSTTFLTWLLICGVGAVLAHLAYANTSTPNEPLEHYSTLARVSMRSETLLACILVVSNIAICVGPAALLNKSLKHLQK